LELQGTRRREQRRCGGDWGKMRPGEVEKVLGALKVKKADARKKVCDQSMRKTLGANRRICHKTGEGVSNRSSDQMAEKVAHDYKNGLAPGK